MPRSVAVFGLNVRSPVPLIIPALQAVSTSSQNQSAVVTSSKGASSIVKLTLIVTSSSGIRK